MQPLLSSPSSPPQLFLGLTQDTHTHTQVQQCFLQPQEHCAQRADTPQLLSGPAVSQQRENTPSLPAEEDFPPNSSMKYLLPPSHSFKRANMWVWINHLALWGLVSPAPQPIKWRGSWSPKPLLEPPLGVPTFIWQLFMHDLMTFFVLRFRPRVCITFSCVYALCLPGYTKLTGNMELLMLLCIFPAT